MANRCSVVLQASAATTATGKSSLLQREGQGAILLATWQEHRTAQAQAQTQAQAAAAHSLAAQMEAQVSALPQGQCALMAQSRLQLLGPGWHMQRGSARSWFIRFAAVLLNVLCCLQKAPAECLLQSVAGAECWLSPSCRVATPAPVFAGPQAVGSSQGGGAGAAGVAECPAAVCLGQV